jgi:hypothetical protein
MLSALLLAHGLVMNGGVVHAVGVLDEDQLRAACAGYSYFGFSEVANPLDLARQSVTSEDEVESTEMEFDSEYARRVSDDGTLIAAFEADFGRNPDLYD